MSEYEVSRAWRLLTFAVLALCGCNRDWDGTRAVAASPSGVEVTAAGNASVAPAGNGAVQSSGLRGPRMSFAALPDRGDLVGYPQQRVVRRQGAYTWHTADVSEAHALRAIGGGVLRLTTPDGQLLEFEYERHVEHRSGDWTWIGRLRDAPPGRQAILTFGAKAVFGNIAQSAAGPLRLAMRDGASWLVETDPALLAGVEERVLRPEVPDFLLPPFYFGSPAAPTASGDTVSAAGESVESSSSTSSSTITVVDVLVGYTSGFATAQGGDSQARTRINFLVDVANQGYVNSQIDARVRLVHAMQVNYPDATDNGDTLEKLTGYKSGSGKTTPDPAFSALRNARETYGADLVTLVRKFHTPENDGCGIAWLIGGGLTTITQGYEYFGYSVVSDGIDQGDDGKNYFCRDETMVHEFGHNMGSAHDIETSKGDDGVLQTKEYGRYTYSFGYRTGHGAGDFYTIMAYREKRDSPPYQYPYRVFSNPNITYCGGYACGTSNADNARSLRETMPIIATFRATTFRSRIPQSDINGDGRSNILWHYDSQVAYWVMSGASVQTSVYADDATPGYSLVTTGDFNGDGAGDFVFSNGSTLKFLINDGTGAGFTHSTLPAGGEWIPFAAADMNGDGKSELVWRYGSHLAYWVMDGANVQASIYVGDASPGFRAILVADFNGDGAGDIVFSNGSTLIIWINNGNGTQYSVSSRPAGGAWIPFTAGDVNGDGKDDLIWRYGSQVAYWIMDGANVISSVYAGDASPGFKVVTLSDFTGDGAGDFVFSNGSTLKIWINNGTGTGFTESSQPAGGAWQLFDPSFVN